MTLWRLQTSQAAQQGVGADAAEPGGPRGRRWAAAAQRQVVPPIGQFKDVRSLDVRESDKLDATQLATWIEQAASIPGWDGGSRHYGGSPLYHENMEKSGASQGQSAAELISKRIAELGDWRGETLSKMRKLIKEADPDVVEEWKWMGTPIWSHGGIICTGESYKNVVKLTFFKGASLKRS